MPSLRRRLGATLGALCAAAPSCASRACAAEAPAVPALVVTAPTLDSGPLSTQSVSGARILTVTNAVTAEDAVRYLPNIFVRRRHIGDTQAPITTRTSGVGASARSLVYADGVLLSALIGNNNSNASPRWGMVAPAEIEQVTVRYGPFQAAYPGNSIGAVVQIVTRSPRSFEADAQATVARQSFAQYGLKGAFRTRQASLGMGDRRGALWWRIDYSRLASDGQPLSYVTAVRPAAPSAAGTPVSGGVIDRNRAGQPILVAGAGGLERQQQDFAKLKLGWEPSDRLHARYLAGYFGQRDEARVQSLLHDGQGAPVYAGTVAQGGYAYTLRPEAFASGLYRWDQAHWMQALDLSGDLSASLQWKATITAYDYRRDRQRQPTALPGGLSGGPGVALDLAGSGWKTADLEGGWTPSGAHRLRGGLHLDRYELQSRRYALADWRNGPEGALTGAAQGKTETLAAWIEDGMRLAPGLDLTLGARLERWRAYNGLNFAPPLLAVQPARRAASVSPKAVLAWTATRWRASASFGVASRFPTVTELYQTVADGAVQRAPDPTLAPERAQSSEVSLERRFGEGGADSLRLSLFAEDVRKALISQSTPLPGGSGQSVSFVQNIGRTRARGAELVFQARDALVDGLDLTASATVVDARIVRDHALPAAEGKRTPQVPRVRWTALASWRATPSLTLSGAARYSDRVYATIDNSDPVTHTYQGFDGYLLLDARAVYRLDPHWSAALGVDNLTDRRYFLFHPFPGRTIVAQVSYSLGERP